MSDHKDPQALALAVAALTLIAEPGVGDSAEKDLRACQFLAHQTLKKIKGMQEPIRPSEGLDLPKASAPAPHVPPIANFYVVHSDGASKGNPGPSGWGIAVQLNGQLILAEGGFIGSKTNQFAELAAALEAIKRTPIGSTVSIITDSEYTQKGLNIWRHGWVRKNWTNAEKKPIANKELWQELSKEADLRKLTAHWVKGHSGDPMNELCDELANEAVAARGFVKRM